MKRNYLVNTEKGIIGEGRVESIPNWEAFPVSTESLPNLPKQDPGIRTNLDEKDRKDYSVQNPQN